MPRPVLARKSLAGKKAVATKVAATTASGTTVTSKASTTGAENSKAKTVGGRATRKAGTTTGEGRVTRRGAAEGSLLEEAEDEWNVLPVEEGSEKAEEEVMKVAAGRTTRGRGKVEVEVQIAVKEQEKRRVGSGKKVVEVEVEDSRKAEVEVEETPAKRRPARSGWEKKTEESIGDTDLTPKAPVREVIEREEVVEKEEVEVVPAQKKKPGRPSKSKAPAKKATGAKKEGKGKGRATDVEDEIPSSPPQISTADSTLQNNIPEQDDLSSTSSIYGDENFLPPPLASSTPKAGAGATATTLPVTPPKPLFRSSEGYTPPPPTHLRSGAGAGPSLAAGPSMGGNLSPIRRRLWESSPAPSSPHPLSQCETPKTAAVVDEGPLGFDIYEDGSQKSPSNAVGADPLSQLMDIDRDARGDGAGANILRTPKKKAAGLEPRKRTSTGTKKSPDGKIVEEDEEEEDDEDDEDEDEDEGGGSSDNDSDGSSSDEATPRAKPVVEAEPKRQKRAPEKEKGPVLTRDLLDLAPRRRRAARGPARATRNREPVVDDLGEDLTSELEDEISMVTKKRGKGGRTTTTKNKGTTITKKAAPFVKKAARGNAAAAVETPKKGRGRGGCISNSKSGGMKTYYRPKSVGGDGGSDGSATPVPADKENDATMVEPSSELTGEDSIGVGKEGRRKLREVKKVFREVDMWEMEFEDVQASSET